MTPAPMPAVMHRVSFADPTVRGVRARLASGDPPLDYQLADGVGTITEGPP